MDICPELVVGGTLEDHTSVSACVTTNHRLLFPEQTTFQEAYWLKGQFMFYLGMVFTVVNYLPQACLGRGTTEK